MNKPRLLSRQMQQAQGKLHAELPYVCKSCRMTPYDCRCRNTTGLTRGDPVKPKGRKLGKGTKPRKRR